MRRGIGSLGHLTVETLNRQLGAGMVHAPQRGDGPVVQDLLSNTVPLGVSSIGTAMQHVAIGKIKPLAVTGPSRSTALPNVPTFRELGFTDPIYDTSVWMAALVPSGTPEAVVTRLATEIRKITGAADVSKILAERGFETLMTLPAEARANHAAELDVVTGRIRQLEIEPQ